MSERRTTVDDGRGGYRDPRLPGVELRWEGETFELWALDRAPGSSGGVFAQAFRVFGADEAPEVSDALAHAVAQCLIDALSRADPAWATHVDRFGDHPGCTIETTCASCLCCDTATTPGCRCEHCRCARPDGLTGHRFVPLEESARAQAERLLAGEAD